MSDKPSIIFHNFDDGPDKIAPFSHAVEVNGWIEVTGQMPMDPVDNSLPMPEGIEAQTHQVMSNLHNVLTRMGTGWSDVIRARIYLTHFERDYEKMNTVYKSYFDQGRLPARTCVGTTGLAGNALVEIDLQVYRHP
ncbi:MAG: RidA family protein [Cellvibrionaceae bacterium]